MEEPEIIAVTDTDTDTIFGPHTIRQAVTYTDTDIGISNLVRMLFVRRSPVVVTYMIVTIHVQRK